MHSSVGTLWLGNLSIMNTHLSCRNQHLFMWLRRASLWVVRAFTLVLAVFSCSMYTSNTLAICRRGDTRGPHGNTDARRARRSCSAAHRHNHTGTHGYRQHLHVVIPKSSSLSLHLCRRLSQLLGLRLLRIEFSEQGRGGRGGMWLYISS